MIGDAIKLLLVTLGLSLTLGFPYAAWLWCRYLRASHKAAELRKSDVSYWSAIQPRRIMFCDSLYTEDAYPWRLRAIRCFFGSGLAFLAAFVGVIIVSHAMQ